MSQEFGLDRQDGLFSLSDRFAEMGGNPVNDDGGGQPKLSDRQLRELCRMHASGEYYISNPSELFPVSRPTGYCTFNRRGPLSVRSCPLPESTPL